MSFSFFFFEKVISFFVKYRAKYFYNNNQYSAFESILFLSPYSCNEIILSFNLCEKIQKFFILPSWDNIYKYYLFDIYDKYIVWGEEQKKYLKNFTAQPIFVLGNVGQYTINKLMLTYDQNPNNKLFTINYSSVTTRIFKNEINFVKRLAKMIENNQFGEHVQLIIRLHPADKNAIHYKKLLSKRVKISNVSGTSLENWDVDNNFYYNLISDFNKSNLVINVASTITLDAILLNKFVINIRPFECRNKMDYYKFQHYLPIKNSSLVPVIQENDTEKLCKIIEAIISNNTQINTNQSKAIEKLTKIHSDFELSTYFNSILK